MAQTRHDDRVGLAQALLNGSCPGPGRKHDPFGHLYLRTIMMVLASVAATSFVILLLFSLSPHASASAPRIIGSGHHCFRRRWTSSSSSRPSPCSSSPTCCPCPRSQPRADRRSSTRVRASRSCSWLFFVCVVEEDTMVFATLRLSWRWRV
jgi:hypothetical protein